MPSRRLWTGQPIRKAVSPNFTAMSQSSPNGLEPRAFPLLDAINAATGELIANGGTGGFQALPRDPRDDNAFGPMDPLRPEAIDLLDSNGRTEPRLWQYPVGWNLPGNGNRETPWAVLRAAAAGVGIIRRCIEARKKDVSDLAFVFAPSEDAINDAYQKNPAAGRLDAEQKLREELMPEMARLREFWRKPWRTRGWDFKQWCRAALEDVLVVDGVPIYPRRTYGGEVYDLELIVPDTIKPLLDTRGNRPLPPFPAYQQLLYGFPRGEWAATAEYDEEGNAVISNGFMSSEMMYYVANTRTFSPFGFSPVEQALFDSRLYLQRQKWMIAEYDDGSTPLTWVETAAPTNGQEMTLTQQKLWERAFNARLAGQTRERHRIKVLPNGWKATQMASVDERYRPEYDLYLIKLLASYFGVTATRLGFGETNGLGGSGFSESQMAVTGELGLKPDTEVLTAIINEASCHFLGMDKRIVGAFVDPAQANSKEQIDGAVAQQGAGQISVNEVRQKLGQSLLPFEEANMPFVLGGPQGIIFLEGAKATIEQAMQAQQMAAETQALGTAGKLSMEEKKLDDGKEARKEEHDFQRESREAEAELALRKAAELRAFRTWRAKAANSGAEPRRPFLFKSVAPDDEYADLEGLGPLVLAFEGWEWVEDQDIEKAAKKTKSPFDWIEWNARNPKHPKGPNGRWVKVGSELHQALVAEGERHAVATGLKPSGGSTTLKPMKTEAPEARDAREWREWAMGPTRPIQAYTLPKEETGTGREKTGVILPDRNAYLDRGGVKPVLRDVETDEVLFTGISAPDLWRKVSTHYGAVVQHEHEGTGAVKQFGATGDPWKAPAAEKYAARPEMNIFTGEGVEEWKAEAEAFIAAHTPEPITDVRGRVWTHRDKDLFVHEGMAWTKDMIAEIKPLDIDAARKELAELKAFKANDVPLWKPAGLGEKVKEPTRAEANNIKRHQFANARIPILERDIAHWEATQGAEAKRAKVLNDLADSLDRAGLGTPESRRAMRAEAEGLEDLARARQARIDAVKPKAEFLADVEEGINIGADSVTLRRMVEQSVRRNNLADDPVAGHVQLNMDNASLNTAAAAWGLRRIGDEGTFDPALHSPVGDRPSVGGDVELVRPGYVFRDGSEEIQLSRAVVDLKVTEPEVPVIQGVDLKPGDKITYADTPVTILGEKTRTRDRFGRDMWRIQARREDTGKEGPIDFGDTGAFALREEPPQPDKPGIDSAGFVTSAMNAHSLRRGDVVMIGDRFPASVEAHRQVDGGIEIELSDGRMLRLGLNEPVRRVHGGNLRKAAVPDDGPGDADPKAQEPTAAPPPPPPDTRWPGWIWDTVVAALWADLLLEMMPGLPIGDLLRLFKRLQAVWPTGLPNWRAMEPQARRGVVNTVVAELRQDGWPERIAQRIGQAIQNAHVEGAYVGQQVGQAVADATLAGGDITGPALELSIDWGGWEPGHPEAARLLLEPGGLERLLRESGVISNRLAEGRMDQIGRIIGEGLANGDPPAKIGTRLAELFGDRDWAHMTALTETNRAMSRASIDQYRAAGMLFKGWMTAFDQRVCPICDNNAHWPDGRPRIVPIDENFPSGDPYPPGHPRCRCAPIPILSIDLAKALNVAQWNVQNPKHPKDSRGRWGETPGSAIRSVLANAEKIGDLRTAFEKEAKRITGNRIYNGLRGNADTAREHMEGILRCLERFPDVYLEGVSVRAGEAGVYATAGGRWIRFNHEWTASKKARAEYLASLAAGADGWDEPRRMYGEWVPTDFHVRNSHSPMSVAIHEFGHILDIDTLNERIKDDMDALIEHRRIELSREIMANRADLGLEIWDLLASEVIEREVSGYAKTNRKELAAEAFTDAMLNGDKASALSRGIFDLLVAEYERWNT